jgi:hypothetical protein
MKICVVGEGPVGLVMSLLFIHFKRKYAISDLDLVLYKSRSSYNRRHVINVDKDLMKEIEKLIERCESCLSGHSSNENEKQITMSINCLETMLHQNVDTNTMNIMENTQFNEHEQINNHYNHIFLCDGFQSKNRKYFIYNNINYSPTKCVFTDQVILVLYTNLPSLGSPISQDCIDNHSEKQMFNTQELGNADIDFDMLIALISIVYNINNRADSFPSTPDMNIIKKDVWTSGFIDFDDFNNLFKKTIKYVLSTSDNTVIFNVFATYNIYISDNMKYLLENKQEMNNIFSKYEDFLLIKLRNKRAEDNPFMVHSVTPNCASHGIILDDNESKLLYCKKIKDEEYAWLVGDSANAYPPGYSLNIGLKDAFYLVKQFLRTNILELNTNITMGRVPDEFIDNTTQLLFSCDTLNNKYSSNLLTSPEVCEYVKNLKFMNGYITKTPENDNFTTMPEIISIINSKTCGENNDLLNLYNLYQLNNFFNNIVSIFCKVSSGGNIKKIKNNKYLKKNKYKNKSKKNKSKRNKSKRNKFKGINKTKKNMKKGRSKRKYPKK